MSIAEKIKNQLKDINMFRVEETQIEQSKPYIEFEHFLKSCEKDIQLQYQDYELLVSHEVNDLGVISCSSVQLLYKSQVIHIISTDYDYLRMTGLSHYVSERSGQIAPLSLQHPVEEKVSFLTAPQSFHEITEDILITEIVANELLIWKRQHKTDTVELIREKIQHNLSNFTANFQMS